MNKYYTSEKHTQILIALMKFHGVQKVVISPGATNVCFVGSLQQDPYFELYSSVDERSAAFIACGLAAESGEPVAITCTGSTASRNYIPGLTEGYYRQLPVLAITATQHLGRVGNNWSQVIDRSQPLKDMVKESVVADCVHTKEDELALETSLNKAFIALRKNGGGPVHINLVTTYSSDFSARELPEVRGIHYHDYLKDMPSLKDYHKIAILVGVHRKWSDELSDSVEQFCRKYNSVVLMNHASNYKGNFGVNHAVILNQKQYRSALFSADLVIYIGSVPRYLSGMLHTSIWRVNPDGEIRDCERQVTRVFAMEEADFFGYYAASRDEPEAISKDHYALQWQKEYRTLMGRMPELPFSNVWIAQNMISKLPDGSVFHLAGSNTARAWNFFELPKTVVCHSNDGTMGIDGQVSSMIGESLASKDRLHYGVVGDLTFFYDMNSLGNRHVQSNFRLMIINNGKGAEFTIYSHPAAAFGEKAEPYMAAAGHYGDKSPALIRHYAQDLGYEYLAASTKEEFVEAMKRFLINEQMDSPMIFEVFTESEKESQAIRIMNYLIQSSGSVVKDTAKDVMRTIAGEKGVEAIKNLLRH